jgi:ABC-type branched-subunit amino acid transport system substrate-binding protein
VEENVMGRRTTTVGAVTLAIALVLAACSTSEREKPEATSGDEPGPTTGLTDDTLTIAYMIPDFGALADSGLVPDLGDPQTQVEAYVEHINDEGGIAGRTVEATFHDYDAADFSGASAREACVGALEDDDAFVVVALPPWPTVGTLCVAEDHATPLITSSQLTPSVMDRTGGRAFTIAMDWAREYKAWAQLLDERGELEGHTIGVVTGDDDRYRQEAIDDGLVPALEDLGYEVAAEAVLPCSSPSCEQHETAVQRLSTKGVDYVFDALGPVASPAFIGAADAAGFHPRYTFPGLLLSDTVAKFHEGVASTIDGMLGVGDYGRPAPGSPSEESEFAAQCNEIYAEFAGVERHSWEEDASGITNLGCLLTEIVKQGAENEAKIPEDLGQDALVRGIEGLGTIDFAGPAAAGCPPMDRSLSFGPDKHDGTDYLLVVEFDAAETRFARLPDCEWIKVP